MGLFGFSKKSERFLTIVTLDGPGRLRLNGLRAKDPAAKKAAVGHEHAVCWIEFTPEGMIHDKGLGRAASRAGQAEIILRDLPTTAICRGVLERLREGQDSVGKWLKLGEPAGK